MRSAPIDLPGEPSVSDDYSKSLPQDPVQPVPRRPGRPGSSRLRRILALVAFIAVMLLMAEMLRMGARPHPHGLNSPPPATQAPR
jgi:hypothetical protein